MYYGQNQEDRIIAEYFGDFVGVFLSVGENDGITFSNTRYFMERGWKGICVEPSPSAYVRLKYEVKKFPGVYAYPFALSHTNGKMLFNESSSLLKKDDVGLVSTFHSQEMERFKSVCTYTPVEVQCFRWKTFLNRLKYKNFDLISIDIEGSELDVLPQIDLTDTRLVCVEWNGKNKDKFIEICTGFKIIAENAENLIFAR